MRLFTHNFVGKRILTPANWDNVVPVFITAIQHFIQLIVEQNIVFCQDNDIDHDMIHIGIWFRL